MSDLSVLGTSLQHSFRFDLLDSRLGIIGVIHPDEKRRVTIKNTSSGPIKRSMQGMRLTAAESTQINPITDRVAPYYIAADGTETPLGVFMWADSSTLARSSGNEVDSTLVDQGLIWSQAVSQQISYPQNQSVYDALVEVLLFAGFGHAVIDHTSIQIASPIAWPGSQQTTYFKVANDLATKQAGFFEPYFDARGLPRVRVVPDLGAQNPALVYSTGKGGRILADSLITSNNLLTVPNVYKVTDTSATAGPVSATFQVDDDLPHSVANRGFAIIRYIEVQGIGSLDQALQVARAASNQDLASFEEVSWSSVLDPRHDTFDVVRVLDDDYLETEWSMTLAPGGPMAHKGKKVKSASLRSPISTTPTPVVPGDTGGGGAPGPGAEEIIGTYQAEQAALVIPDPGGTPPGGTGQFVFGTAGSVTNPDGQKIRIMGGNLGLYVVDTPFINNMNGKSTKNIADVHTWGWNAVRGVANSGGTPVVRAQEFYKTYQTEKLIAIAELHDATGGDWGPSDGRWQPLKDWWQAVLADATVRNSPYTWVNFANEYSAANSNTGNWANVANMWYTFLRTTCAFAGVIVIDCASYGQGAPEMINQGTVQAFMAGKTKVIISWHNYGAGGGSDAADTACMNAYKAANIPLFCGEFGWAAIQGESGASGWDTDRRGGLWVINVGAPAGIGGLWWGASGDTNSQSSYSLRYQPPNNGTFADYQLPLSGSPGNGPGGGQMWWDRSRESHVLP